MTELVRLLLQCLDLVLFGPPIQMAFGLAVIATAIYQRVSEI